jgi:hypothetical protein
MAWAASLAVIVLGQGVPRGVESRSSATSEAWLFDGVAMMGIIVITVLFTATGVLLSTGSEIRPFSPPLRRVVATLMILAVALSFFVLGVAGAMGWHDLGYGNGNG